MKDEADPGRPAPDPDRGRPSPDPDRGRPSPDTDALARVGVVDVGSNSVRLVVFDGAARSPAYFYNEKVMCGLGRGMSETGRLNPEGRARALAAIKRFALLSEGMGIAPLSTVATAAVRDAEDGPEFRAEVEDQTGLRLWVVDGAEEARLSAQGILLGWPEAKGAVCDIGGSSMELASVEGGRIGARATSPLGPLKLQDLDGAKARRKAIEKGLDDLAAAVPPTQDPLYLVGGSWRAIGRLDMERRGYPLHVLHEYRMSVKEAQKTIEWIAENDIADLKSRTGLSESRISLVPLACEVLEALLGRWKPDDVILSAYGIREGMLYEQMDPELRARDPLIEAARFGEAKDARQPGFGEALAAFLRPLCEAGRLGDPRLMRAACLLHDVNWRAHPDYRPEVCFESATRANLGGLDHEGRVFLGVALMHRYKNSRDARFDPLVELLPEARLERAVTLGKAMRFGAMLTAADPTMMGALEFDEDAERLTYVMRPETAALFGEVAQARFKSLGGALGVETDARVGD